ncbi:MAG: hypothetical protein CSA81_07065 [Acidobacteria bacterium]|nr:MAG: hypothetical protein CSA81_07065 [Acidobacteriota bacterium]
MTEQTLDYSAIETLKELKEEKEVILGRIEKMEEKKDSVSSQVYKNVSADYHRRLGSIEQKAEPLKNEVRSEYVKLKTKKAVYQDELKKIELEKEELVFRHQLGEFEEDDFETQFKEIDTRLSKKSYSIEEIDEIKEEFLKVFDSEEDLESEPAHEYPEPETAPEPELKSEPEPAIPDPASLYVDKPESTVDIELSDSFTEFDPEQLDSEELVERDFKDSDLDDIQPDMIAPPIPGGMMEADLSNSDIDPSVSDLETAMEGLEDVDEFDEIEAELSETDLLEADDVETHSTEEADQSHATLPGQAFEYLNDAPGMVPPPPPTPELSDEPATVRIDKSQLNWDTDKGETEGTMIISNPKIIAIVDGKEGQVFSLGMGTTTLGRSPENDIHIPEERISRKHAQVSFGPGGYSIYDMNSENGTYVNGSRVQEQILTDGDVILIGTTQFVFREK